MSMNNSLESSPQSDESLGVRDNLWVPMFKFEEGRLSMGEVVTWFTMLIETGYIWNMPDTYIDSAAELINNGYIGSPDREVN